jgi:hypothetical protein
MSCSFCALSCSARFDKQVLLFSGLAQVPVIEATEFSDLLVLTHTAAQGGGCVRVLVTPNVGETR